MCLDPRPDRLIRATRPARRLSRRQPLLRATQAPPHAKVVVRAPALWALEHLAGDDDLVARGWVVLSRQA
jgi:hypothetical protein